MGTTRDVADDAVEQQSDRASTVEPLLNLSVRDAIVSFLLRRPDWPAIRRQLGRGLANWVFLDLRYSFLVIAGLCVVGVVVQCFLPHGWSVWPVVFACGVLAVIDEASDRNGVGVPPLRIAAFVLAVLGAWLALSMFLKAVHPIIPLMGLAVAAFYGVRGQMKKRAWIELMGTRVMNGQCAHCGEDVDEGVIDCPHCGQLTNPEGVRARWSTLAPMGAVGQARTRAVLKGETGAVTAHRKEQALLDRRVRPQGRKR